MSAHSSGDGFAEEVNLTAALTTFTSPASAWTIGAHLASAVSLGVPEGRLALWREHGGGELEPALTSGAVALLDAQWIISHAEASGVLTHRQSLPREAFLSLADLIFAMADPAVFGLPVAVLSCPWLTTSHPDPRGANLSRVAKALKALLGSSYISRLGVFWDFGSLHQHPDPANGVMRTEEQNALFKQGLDCLGTLYSHPFTTVLRLTSFPDGHKTEEQPEGANVAEYFDRGWCYAESSWASLTKRASFSLDLGRMRPDCEYDRPGLIFECTRGNGWRPPLLPPQFAAELEAKRVTEGEDRPVLQRLYEGAFHSQLGRATRLDCASLGWGDAEASQLAAVLASGAAPRLEQLDLSGNQVGDAGLAELSAALSAVPRLERVDLRANRIGDGGIKALSVALATDGTAPRLETLNLSSNMVSDEGLKVLAIALKKKQAAPSLKNLTVESKPSTERVAGCKRTWVVARH